MSIVINTKIARNEKLSITIKTIKKRSQVFKNFSTSSLYRLWSNKLKKMIN